MPEHSPASPRFDEAVRQVRAADVRDDLTVREIASPAGVAPESYALAGDVRPDTHGESAYGTGRFILLHDPAEPQAWDGAWRIVTFAQAPLEPELSTDPLLAGVAWSWLEDALESRGASHTAASGTATKSWSRGFGSLAGEPEGAQIELRASWSPTGDVRDHVEAWAELVCMLAGLPPGSEQVEVLGPRRWRA